MASAHRTTRRLVVTTCLLASLGVPAAAVASPPDHAPAHGRSDREAGTARTATSATGHSRDADGRDDGGGHGRGRDDAPGQRRRADDAPVRRAAAPGGPDTATPTPPPSTPAPDQPASVEGGREQPPAAEPAEPAAPTPPRPPTTPAPTSDAAAVATTAPAPGPEAAPTTPAAVAPTTTAAPGHEPNVVGGPPGRQVWRPDVGGAVRGLVDGVDRGVRRLDELVPRDLVPDTEPLARLVPLLLAVLGAFLALQRGIGSGLGHVPMVASAALGDPLRRE